jgi:hypothetical protein
MDPSLARKSHRRREFRAALQQLEYQRTILLERVRCVIERNLEVPDQLE